MKKDEMLSLIHKRDFRVWNSYRQSNPEWIPDFSGLDLGPADLVHFNLMGANLCNANLSCCRLIDVGMSKPGERLNSALYDVGTKFPKELDPIACGLRYVFQHQQGMGSRRSEIFISYAWANENVISAIDQWLTNKGLLVRLDKRDFFAGRRIRDEIVRIMERCDHILIFYSKASKDKPWPQFERELAEDLEMSAKKEGKKPPRLYYVVIDDTPLPNVSEANRIAIMAAGRKFDIVCEEIYRSILELRRETERLDLSKWSDYVFG